MNALFAARMFVCAAAVVASLSGCPRKGPGAGPADGTRPFDPRSAVPADVMAVALLDVPTLLSRPGLKEDPAVVQQLTDRVRLQIGIDPALLRDATLFYAPTGNEVLPRRGAAIVPLPLRDSPGIGKLGVSELHGGHAVFRLGETAAVSFLDRGTIVGDPISVRASIDALGGKRAALKPDDALWKLAEAMGRAPFRLAFRGGALGPLLSRLALQGADKIEAVGVAADVTEKDLVLDLVATAGDTNALAEALRKLQGQWSVRLSKSTFLKMFADLLAGLKIEVRGTEVVVSAKLPLDLVRSMLPMVMGSLGM